MHRRAVAELLAAQGLGVGDISDEQYDGLLAVEAARPKPQFVVTDALGGIRPPRRR
jgi:hypothetical protein